MVLAAVPVRGLHIGQSGVTTLPGNLPSKQGYLAVQRYFPGQSQDPAEIVSVGGAGSARADLAKLETALAGDPRFGPGVVQASPDGTILTLTVPIRGDDVSSQDVAAVLNMRQQLIGHARTLSDGRFRHALACKRSWVSSGIGTSFHRVSRDLHAMDR